MSSPRLLERVPSAHYVSVATLEGHTLRYHKVSKDGSAKCNILATSQAEDFVLGVVFEIPPDEKTNLDKAEGLGFGYEIKTVSIRTAEGKYLEAFTYYATIIDDRLLPYDWYKDHVVKGAIEHGLPKNYIEAFIEVPAVTDPDPTRASREKRLYKRSE